MADNDITPLEAVDKRIELRQQENKYKQLYSAITIKIRERKTALKASGIPKSQDMELIQLQNKATLVNAKLSQIKLQIAQLPAMPQPEPAKKKKRILPLPNEETIGIWQGLNLFQLKLVNLMITEIGMTRFRELRKLASDDVAGKLAEQKYEPQPEAEQPKTDKRYDVDFEKMMRSNYNKFAGDEI